MRNRRKVILHTSQTLETSTLEALHLRHFTTSHAAKINVVIYTFSKTFHMKYGVVTQHKSAQRRPRTVATILLKSSSCQQTAEGGCHASSLFKAFTVIVVHTMAWADPLQIGDVVAQLLDALNLLVEEVAFNEISHLKKENR